LRRLGYGSVSVTFFTIHDNLYWEPNRYPGNWSAAQKVPRTGAALDFVEVPEEKVRVPTISVIIPAYNAEDTILATVNSVQQQTFSDLEIIVINDGSRDKTLDVVKGIVDTRLKVFSYKNAGAAVARNRGLAHATGEFIAFIDADDLWTPDKLELQLAALQEHPEAGVAYCWTTFIDENCKFLYVQPPVYFEGNVYPQLLVKNFLCCGSIPLVRRQAIESVGELDPSLESTHDWDYWLRLAARWTYVLVPKHQVFYRQTSGSISSKIEVRERYHLMAIEKAFKAAPPDLQYLKKQTLANLYQQLTRLYIDRRLDAEGIEQAGMKLQRAIRFYPKILLNRNTQRLAAKWLLIRLLSPRFANYLVQFLSELRASHDSKSTSFSKRQCETRRETLTVLVE
jgi:glycosyltransferase involved in cell wall biosynthesis